LAAPPPIDYAISLAMDLLTAIRHVRRIPSDQRNQILRRIRPVFQEYSTWDHYHDFESALRKGDTRSASRILEILIARTQRGRGIGFERGREEMEREMDRARMDRIVSEFGLAQRRMAQLETENEELRRLAERQAESEAKDQGDSVAQFEGASNRVFVIMPLSPDLEDVWIGAIKRGCTSNNFCSLRVDEIGLSSTITEDIKSYVDKSTTVIADITGNNPNVMFELGYALAKGKDPIIIRQSESEKAPFDVAGYRYISYHNSWQGIEALTKEIGRFLKTTLESQKKRKQKSGKASNKPSKASNRSPSK